MWLGSARPQGELASSQALIKGTALDFSFLLPNSPWCLAPTVLGVKRGKDVCTVACVDNI